MKMHSNLNASKTQIETFSAQTLLIRVCAETFPNCNKRYLSPSTDCEVGAIGRRRLASISFHWLHFLRYLFLSFRDKEKNICFDVKETVLF